MISNITHDTPLSIGLYSPAWPLESFPNGIVTYVGIVAESLKTMGHKVTILAGQVGEGFSDPDVYDMSAQQGERTLARRVLDPFSFRLAGNVSESYYTRKSVAEAIRRAVVERNIQILEMEETFGWVHWVRRSISIAVCVRLHGPWFLNGKALGTRQDIKFRRRVKSERRGIIAADAVTSPSQEVMNSTREYYGLPMTKAEVIPNPTRPVSAVDRWDPQDADPRKILFVGRFDRHKGGDLMIESFAHVLREFPDAKLCFVGPDRGCVDDQGRTRNIEEFAREKIPHAMESGSFAWLGQQPHNALHSLRRGAAITVIPSRFDNFPNTAQEALAAGCPIVASDAGGIPEIVRDGVTGRLHKSGDSDDLAAKIIATLRDPNRAAVMAHQAAVDCEQRFYPDVIAARLVESYREVLKTHVK